jgi:ATP-dependent protease Clp ATPase subunit
MVGMRIRRGARAAAPHGLSQSEALRALEPVDLIAYGLIPEFVGRLPVLITLRPLDGHELVRIMAEPLDGPMRRLGAEFAGIGAELVVDPLWMHHIAAEAIAKGTGARAIESVLRPALRDAFYAARAGDRVMVDSGGSWRVEKGPPAPHSPSENGAKLAEEPQTGTVSETAAVTRLSG